MNPNGLPRILLVDDELSLLEALVRGLRRLFDIETAPGGQAALEILHNQPGFTVIVSDLRMPGMDGISFLKHARQTAPDGIRVLFTGNADLADAIEAVNQGAIFRFITKPCPLPGFKNMLDAAVEQHRLVTAEKVLLEQTLQGSVKALSDVMALVSPMAFGRGIRARRHVSELASQCGVGERWPVEVACTLSQIGCVALPPELIEKLYQGRAVTKDEQTMIERLPVVTEQLLANIPRLEPVRRILLYQNKQYNGEGHPVDSVKGDELPWGARALKIVFDFDLLESQGLPAQEAFSVLHARAGWYDPSILKVMTQVYRVEATGAQMKQVTLRDVRPGMEFAEDVKTTRGLLLIARGQKVTPGLMERISNFPPTLSVKQPILVTVHDYPEATENH
ncbi:MAG TPA: HD domain-containing phosphohydrolase [Terriglobia bacterium]|nr:HD domain-containing phosphohydrolase [Terriglobia bacterium]